MKINPKTLAKIANLDAGAELIVSSPKTNVLQRIPVSEFFSTEGISPMLEKVVDITSEDLLTMGTNPIELLPAPDINKYYHINKFIFECSQVTTPYTLSDLPCVYIEGFAINLPTDLLTTGMGNGNVAFVLNSNSNISKTPADYYNSIPMQFAVGGSSVTLGTYGETDPVDGDGTLRVKIYYTIRTFGE